MKLIDLISLISEHSRVRVVDAEAREVALYDGKDSIPSTLNDKDVLSVRSEIGATAKAEIVIEI